MNGCVGKKTVMSFISVLSVFCLAFIICCFGIEDKEVYAATTVKNPTVSLKAGKYVTDEPISIELSCATKKATIYFSVDGENFTKYVEPIVISKNTTITAYAKKGKVKSEKKVFKYKLVPSVTVTPSEGSYYGSRTVKLTSELSKVRMYYTTDGSKPTIKSKKYTKAGIVIDGTTRLRVLVKKTGWTKSYLDLDYEILFDEGGVEFSAEVDDINDYTQKILYNTLDPNEKEVYREIFDGFMNFADKTGDLTGYAISDERAKAVKRFVVSENPQLFWADDSLIGFTYNQDKTIAYLNLFYTNTEEEVAERQVKLEEKAQDIIDNGKERHEGLFDFVLYLHDTICEMTEYDMTDVDKRVTAGTDDVLLDGRGLCVGYARAFSYLCQMSGIPCINIEGELDVDGEGLGHCWNKVFLGGEWYNVDVCLDDQQNISHVYCCLTDKRIEKDHFEEDIFSMVALAAESNKFSYIEQMGCTEYENLEDAYNGLLEECARKIKRNDSCQVTIYYSSDDGLFGEQIDERLRRTAVDGERDTQGIWADIKAVDFDAYRTIAIRGSMASWHFDNNSFTIEITLR